MRNYSPYLPDYSGAAYTIISTEIGLTIVALIGRIVSQRLANVKLATDDHICYSAFVSSHDSFSKFL